MTDLWIVKDRKETIMMFAGEPELLDYEWSGVYLCTIDSSMIDVFPSIVKDLNVDCPIQFFLAAPDDVIKVHDEDFFYDLASKIRVLWPAGEKNGTYPWRDSVSNIAKRLKILWKDRNLDKYSIDDCLTAARKYLNQYENNTKYMQILKYFIMKQKYITEKDGRLRQVNESKFADILECVVETNADDEFEKLMYGNNNDLI